MPSATPSKYELQQSGEQVAEQIVRPTGLLDPEIEHALALVRELDAHHLERVRAVDEDWLAERDSARNERVRLSGHVREAGDRVHLCSGRAPGGGGICDFADARHERTNSSQDSRRQTTPHHSQHKMGFYQK